MIRLPRKHTLGTRARHSGQSVVEFALVAPLLVVVLFAIVDFARIYTTMMSVESSAREAADYGTTLGASKWQDGVPALATEAEMEKRACVAASNLPDYQDADDDPGTGCDNPSFDWCIDAPDDADPCGPLDPADNCDNPKRGDPIADPTHDGPCTVTVTMTYDFRLLVPLHFDFLGVEFGLPSTITLQRDSTFAMTDIDIAAGP